ncbi:GNAT family N-acetyltransferase [Lacinutrix chionoecetis]
MIFETERLIIRQLHITDSNGFYDMQSNLHVMQHIKDFMNRAESEKELNKFIEYYDNKNRFFKIWAVVEKKSNVFIGICGVYKNENDEFEIAYRLRELYWKKGFGKEIARNLIAYCFEKANLNEITAYVRVLNNGSVNILEKEMKFKKEFHCEKTNSLERLYKLKKEDWLEKQTQ